MFIIEESREPTLDHIATGDVVKDTISLLRLIKLMIQLHQRPLLYPRHIAAADAQFLRNLPLRPLVTAVDEAEAADDDLFFLIIQYIEVFVYFRFLDLQLHLIRHIVGFRAEDVNERNFVTFLVRTDRVVEGHVLARFLKRS